MDRQREAVFTEIARRTIGPAFATSMFVGFSEFSDQALNISGGCNVNTVLLVILILLLVGAAPVWPHSANWGYFPSGGLGLVVLILLILLLTGRL